MRKKIIEQIIDKKSYGIREYAIQLNTQINKTPFLKGIIKNFDEVLSTSYLKIFHYSNSTRKVILPLLKQKSKSFVIVHDVIPRNKIIRPFNQIIFLLINKKADKIIVHTSFAKKLLLKNYKFISEKKVKIIPHGTFLNPISKEDKIRIRKKYGFSKNNFLIGMFGGISKRRGQITFIKEFKRTTEKNLRLIIAGKCEDKRINSIIDSDKRIIILGFLKKEDLIEIMKMVDVLAIYREDSVGETSGVISYAQGMGIPIIASKIGSFKECFLSKDLLFNNNKINLNKLLNKVIRNKKKYSRESLLIAKKNSWENYLTKMLKL